MIALDTYVFFEAMNNNKAAIKILNEVKHKGGIISALVLTELLYHLTKRKLVDEYYKIRVIIEDLNIKIVPVNEEIAELAGKIRAKYYSKERQISFIDCIHLATAIVCCAEKFVTGDKDFLGIEEIEVEIL